MSRRKAFANERGYTMHFQKSPSCLDFVRQETMGAIVNRKREHSFVNNTTVSSSKKTSILRCEMVNTAKVDPSTTDSATLKDDNHTMDDNDHVVDYKDGDNNEANHHFDVLENTTAEGETRVILTHPFFFTCDHKWTIALMKLLDDMNAPDYAFTSVLKWARGASEEGYSFNPKGGQSRMQNVDVLFNSIQNAKRLLPTVKRVDVPHGPACDVITFEFAPQLLRLLQNPAVMTVENLAIDIVNPLVPYSSASLGEAISGKVYRDAYARYISNPQKEFFVPIIQWIDRTHVTGNARFSLKPYMFTPAIFTETFRRRIQAWGYHGFLPKSKASAAQNKKMKQGNNIRNYHAQLSAVLDSFVTAGPQLRNVLLPIGPNGSMRVDVITCLLFVIQDMQEGDQLCGRFGPHTPGIARHCRACNIKYEDLDLPNAQCHFVLAEDMAQISRSPDKALRTKWSQHRLDNAFDKVPMADPVRGIFGATPVETMHAFRKGLIEVVTFLVLDNITATDLADLDTLAIDFHKSHRQTIRRSYPVTDFSNGITNLTKISAAERLGLVFLFVILAQYDQGWNILCTALSKKNKAQLNQVIHVFEAMLCFDRWLCQPTYWQHTSHDQFMQSVQQSIRVLMQHCIQHINMMPDKNYKFPKFHELLHIVHDMERFGAPTNFCAQRPESLLIPVAKQPGRRAQKRHEGSSFELQAAQRLSYSLMIDTVHTRIWKPFDHLPMPASGNTSDTTSVQQGTGKGTFGTVTSDAVTGNHVTWCTSTKIALMQPADALLNFLVNSFGAPVRICTEYCRGDDTYRCHPAYQSGAAIYDWMHVEFKGANKSSFIVPCRLAAVVVLEMLADTPEPYRLVVQCAEYPTGINSVLLTEWTMSQTYYIVKPSSVLRPCFVICITKDDTKILETLPLEEWPSKFT